MKHSIHMIIAQLRNWEHSKGSTPHSRYGWPSQTGIAEEGDSIRAL